MNDNPIRTILGQAPTPKPTAQLTEAEHAEIDALDARKSTPAEVSSVERYAEDHDFGAREEEMLEILTNHRSPSELEILILKARRLALVRYGATLMLALVLLTMPGCVGLDVGNIGLNYDAASKSWNANATITPKPIQPTK